MSIITDLRDAFLARFAVNSAPNGGYGSPAVWDVTSPGQKVLANSLAEAIAPALGGAGEPALGNPASNGQVLSSTAAGVRSWITPAAGGSSDATKLVKYTTAQRLSLSAEMAMVCFDTDLLQICVYVGNGWMAIPYAGMVIPSVLINDVPTNGLMPPQNITAPNVAVTVALN